MPGVGFQRAPMTEEQEAQSILFLAAVRGADAWTVAQVLSRFTPGRDWRKCSKALMARDFAEAKAPRFGFPVDARQSTMRAVDLLKLRAALDAALKLKGRAFPA